MNSAKKKRMRDAIKTFYDLNHDKGKAYTFKEFKKCGYSRSQVYRIIDSFEKRGFQDHKVGGGRPEGQDS